MPITVRVFSHAPVATAVSVEAVAHFARARMDRGVRIVAVSHDGGGRLGPACRTRAPHVTRGANSRKSISIRVLIARPNRAFVDGPIAVVVLTVARLGTRADEVRAVREHSTHTNLGSQATLPDAIQCLIEGTSSDQTRHTATAGETLVDEHVAVLVA